MSTISLVCIHICQWFYCLSILLFLRNHQFDAQERFRGKQKRKKGDVSDLNAPARGIKPVRQHHKRDESKILPHVRRGLQFDCLEKNKD